MYVFLPKSHNFCNSLRISPSYISYYESLRNEIPKYATYEPTKKGEGFLINHAVIHGSSENISSNSRVAVVLGIYSKNAQLTHYFKPKINENLIEKYHIGIEDMINLEKDRSPTNLSPVSNTEHTFQEKNKSSIKKKLFSKKRLLINKFLGYH